MTSAHGYAAFRENRLLRPFAFLRRDPGPLDVVIDIRYCGICHTDLNAVANIRGNQTFPLVPGHEIVGVVSACGGEVTKFRVGDWAGVGTIVDSCRHCLNCVSGDEPYCEAGMTGTYGFLDRHGQMAYGGYANNYVVEEHFAVSLPVGLDRASAAPLLCAGITTYAPLKRAGIGPGAKVGVIGLGGLGHVAVKIARAMGAHVSVLSTTSEKKADALRLGANELIDSRDQGALGEHGRSFDFLLDTVSGEHDLDTYLPLLRLDGTLCLVGMPAHPLNVSPTLLAVGRRMITGSMIGGIAQTEEMLVFCAEHGIAADIELITIDTINDAFARLEAGDVRYRFVIDMASLPKSF